MPIDLVSLTNVIISGILTGLVYGLMALGLSVIFVIVLGAAGLFVYLIHDLHRHMLSLVEQAARISKGEFTVPLVTTRADELGDLARSVERMRSSLRAVLSRVGSEPPVTQSRRGQA